MTKAMSEERLQILKSNETYAANSITELLDEIERLREAVESQAKQLAFAAFTAEAEIRCLREENERLKKDIQQPTRFGGGKKMTKPMTKVSNPAYGEIRKLMFDNKFELADVAKRVGVSPNYVSDLIRGAKRGTYATRGRIADVLGSTPEKLFPNA